MEFSTQSLSSADHWPATVFTDIIPITDKEDSRVEHLTYINVLICVPTILTYVFNVSSLDQSIL